MGLASDLGPRLVVLLPLVSFAESQVEGVGEATPYLLLTCRADNPSSQDN